jgi:hypothetical protein
MKNEKFHLFLIIKVAVFILFLNVLKDFKNQKRVKY